MVAAGKVDPETALTTNVNVILKCPHQLFPDVRERTHLPGPVTRASCQEYIKLIASQLRNGKLALTCSLAGGGTSFAIGKKDSSKLREVWNGSALS